MKAYLIEYWSDSGVELTTFNAENIEEAKEKFLSTQDQELNQIFLISESDVIDYDGSSSSEAIRTSMRILSKLIFSKRLTK